MGSGGRVVVAFPGLINGGFDTVSVLPDGRLVFAGLLNVSPQATAGGAARLTADGRLDPTYGSGGVAETATIDSGRFVNTSLSAAVDASGRAVFDVREDNPHVNFLYRLNGAGVPDMGFGSNGKAVLNSLPGPAPDVTHGLAALPNGSILLGGPICKRCPALLVFLPNKLLNRRLVGSTLILPRANKEERSQRVVVRPSRRLNGPILGESAAKNGEGAACFVRKSCGGRVVVSRFFERLL